METRLIRRVAVSGAAGLLAAVVVHLERGYPWKLSLIVGLACGVLVASVLQTTDRLRSLYRDR